MVLGTGRDLMRLGLIGAPAFNGVGEVDFATGQAGQGEICTVKFLAVPAHKRATSILGFPAGFVANKKEGRTPRPITGDAGVVFAGGAATKHV